MSTATLNIILQIQLLSPPVGEYNPASAITKWVTGGITRRPKLRMRGSKRLRIEDGGHVNTDSSSDSCESSTDYNDSELSDSELSDESLDGCYSDVLSDISE